MRDLNNKALEELAKSSKKELAQSAKRWKAARVTKLVRFSTRSHYLVKQLAKERKMTMSKTLDFIINKFIKNQKHYEID